MKEYLENRIKQLKEADAKAGENRWDMSRPEFERKACIRGCTKVFE